ncbi:hypothetical protein CcrC1_gp136 [Caulobacter phage C1]|nr:hypothetical protein CcrC1_gp136 [Caulobacter phage C1]UTU08365.1 hypothetical protein CcrC2_gp137 [Caulobacter phage C2]UTU08882.1 hypothetical protein CcrJ4_gp131 [Caulobacter phage J4]UTU09438.1 hypothetical protein CcrBL47_gp152 [Caulobacter phage BL47]UTU09998.1 hypothetical protein CcrRB23_gp136 [Caulobacter phage RB23]WGN97023.1 hypothetical protein [Bertelyvirus sp.]
MKPAPTMTQCRLTRGDQGVQVSWIPSEFAQVGRIVDLKEKDYWSNGWRVDQTWGTMDASVIADRSRDHLNHSKATGDRWPTARA